MHTLTLTHTHTHWKSTTIASWNRFSRFQVLFEEVQSLAMKLKMMGCVWHRKERNAVLNIRVEKACCPLAVFFCMFVCKKCQCLRQNEDMCRGFRAEQIPLCSKVICSLHTSFLFYPSVRVLQIFEVDWEGEMQQYEPLLCVQNFSLFTSPLCSTLPSVLSLHTQVLSVLPFYVFISSHTSSLFYPSVCVLICSHTSHLFYPSVCVLICSHTHKASLFYPSVRVLICSHTSLFYPSVFLSVHTRHLCSTCLCYLFTHKSSVLPLCVVCSHMSSLCYPSVCPCSYLFTAKSLFYPSMFLSVHTQIVPVLPICVIICSHTVICSTLLSVFFSVHTQVHLVLPHCLCSYLFTHKPLFYPSVCVLICSHTSPCSTPLSVCSSDLWGGPGRRDTAVWAIQGTAQPPASVARVTYHQLCWHSVTGSAHCPSRGPRGMYWSWELDVCQNGYMFDNRMIY